MQADNIKTKVDQWLKSNISKAEKAEIESLLQPENKSQLEDAFYKDLEFGTGGLRGLMGVGSNRMNKYTVGKATQGLANYINKSFLCFFKFIFSLLFLCCSCFW